MTKNIFKAIIICAVTLVSTESYSSNSEGQHFEANNTITEVFKVYGNCGMCKNTIESSLKNEKGVQSVDWDKETKLIEVTFDESLITLEEIKKRIASVGYDSDEFKAQDSVYDSLPSCCQYERETGKSINKSKCCSKGHNH